MMINSHNHSAFLEEMQRCQDYIQALEEERRKIQVFQRELPLCLELVTQAIEACKQRLSGTTTDCNLNGQSECNSEQTSSDVPVFEEFIPIKRVSSQSDGEEQESKKPKNGNIDVENGNEKYLKKSDWLRSVQLWNQTPDPPPKEDYPEKAAVVEVNRNGSGGAFHPFKKEKREGSGGAAAAPPLGPVDRSAPPASNSSTEENGGGCGNGNKKEGKEGQSQRKVRRCWSPELHRKFLQALRQLGGSHAATPKQIRELMQVDGLTNDEVKSHLQKYRLHTRRAGPLIHNSHNTSNDNAQTPQFVVVGGIWMPPEYAAMAATTTTGQATGTANSKEIYAPIAAVRSPFREASASHKHRQENKPSNSDDRGSNNEGGVQSHSPATSTHTATVLPPY